MGRVFALIAAATMLMGFAAPAFAPGQVWSYDHRAKDEGSLLKIQKIGKRNGQPVYHVSLIQVSVNGFPIDVHHMPFTKEALTKSVRTKVADPGGFPEAGPSIEEWNDNKGGVFTIPVKEATELLELSMKPAGSKN